MSPWFFISIILSLICSRRTEPMKILLCIIAGITATSRQKMISGTRMLTAPPFFQNLGFQLFI